MTQHLDLWAGMLLENYSSFIYPCIHIETLYIAKTIKERKKDQEQVREKSFPEMKKDVGMTTAQKSKETRNGNGINLCSVYPANNPYIYVHYYTII